MKIRQKALATAAVLLGTACSEAVAPEPMIFLEPLYDFVVESDIVYASVPIRDSMGNDAEKDLRLDVYRPLTPSWPVGPRLRPGIVLIHGGGFTSGSKISESVRGLGRRFAELGYVAISIDYRLTGDDPPTEALATDPTNPVKVAAAAARIDAALAVQWLRDHATQYAVDPDRIAVAGYSAGGITALGVTYWQPGVQRADVRVAFSLSGGLHESEDSIDTGEPPAILVHGADDTAAPWHEAVASRAAAVGVAHQMHVIPGVNHQEAPGALDEPIGETTAWREVSHFLFEHLDLAPLYANVDAGEELSPGD